MNPPLSVVEAAESFWAVAGAESTFPRDIRRAVARVHPIAIVLLSALHIAKAEAWLRRQGMAFNIGEQDRPLRACLVAQSGQGIIFVDGNDPDAEQRFSIAHELAHFLRDYLAPRRVAAAAHGEAILEVFDGLRPARPDERTIAILAGSPIHRHVHLMGREGDDSWLLEVHNAEGLADALAIELLAPWEIVTRHIEDAAIARDRFAITRVLSDCYGLPAALAGRYARHLSPDAGPRSPLLQHLRRVERSRTAEIETHSRHGLP